MPDVVDLTTVPDDGVAQRGPVDLTVDSDDGVAGRGPSVDLTADSDAEGPHGDDSPHGAATKRRRTAAAGDEAAAASGDAAEASSGEKASGDAAASAAVPPAPSRLSTDRVSPPISYECRKAHHGFTGGTENTDDEKSQRPYLRLEALPGDKVVVVACADIHRHFNDEYLWVDDDAAVPPRQVEISLSAWLASRTPLDVGVIVFAGDLGLEQNDELASGGVRSIDIRATGARPSGFQKEAEAVDAWRGIAAAVCAARPRAQVVFVGGNHDGLLCEAKICQTCKSMDRFFGHSESQRRTCWGSSPAAAVDAVAARLAGDGDKRVHVLRRSKPRLELRVVVANGGAEPERYTTLRIAGSAWTPRVPDDFGVGAGHNTLDSSRGQDLEWRAHWRGVFKSGCDLAVVHGPPLGILDLCGTPQGKAHVGCRHLYESLESKPPRAVVFGHVHAKQWQSEPENAPRFAFSRSHRGTLFVNAASEKTIPNVTGFRLQRADGMYDDPRFSPRPPTTFEIALNGYRSTEADYWGSDAYDSDAET
ncbi:hypothetical protein M885DRAFT_579382 [Pelagophyceae sp. CCMP2097]|nr:hypothetical protein M885DRAFT_579382 [Pelagophyceae sp. CCMP2097]|mmetsp:Transcript_24277/g.86702  ORF Transcript_24277/g.86702 Transcript_24277/m.86702 type:complete len:534 (-) Transcript_24277:83-1684(-)